MEIAEVIDKKAASEIAPGSIWTRSTTLASSAQTALLYTVSLRTPLSSWRDAADLRAFRLKDVLQPPGACTYVQNKTNTLFSSPAMAIFFQLSASSTSLSHHATSFPGIQFASFYWKRTRKTRFFGSSSIICAAKKSITIFCRRWNLVGITCDSRQGTTLMVASIVLPREKCCSLCSFLTFFWRIWSFCGGKTQGCKWKICFSRLVMMPVVCQRSCGWLLMVRNGLLLIFSCQINSSKICTR